MVQIPTARGDTIDAKDVGFSLLVEAVLGPTWAEIENNWPDHTISRWPQEELAEMTAKKLETAYEHGVRTICDRVIPGETGRNVPRLKKVAERTRINIVIGTGGIPGIIWHSSSLPRGQRNPQLFPHVAFGGHKQSGIGIDNALDGLSEYTNAQTIVVRDFQTA